jgi:hypothetical protein
VAFSWLSNVIAQQNTGARVYFRLRPRWWRWLRLLVCDIFKVFKVGKGVQVFDRIFVDVKSTMQSKFNALQRTANSQILPECNLKVFRMV